VTNELAWGRRAIVFLGVGLLTAMTGCRGAARSLRVIGPSRAFQQPAAQGVAPADQSVPQLLSCLRSDQTDRRSDCSLCHSPAFLMISVMTIEVIFS
jgi:hypothetical protein